MTTTPEKPTVTLYTDGGCQPNPGPGGWAAILIFEKDDKKHVRELSGGEPETTNNRMELTAAIQGLRALKQPCFVELYTDSRYVKNGINEWMPQWLKNNFKQGKIQNVDLWRTLSTEVARHEIHWHWVKGHAGNEYNERADQLAVAAIPAVAPSGPEVDDEPSARAYLGISCLGTPGVGAWGVLLEQDGKSKVLTGGHPKTNANRLDLLAAIAALESVSEGEPIKIFTGNSYLRDGITQWITGWKKNNWMKKTGGEVQYRDLWQRLDQLTQARKVQWVIVKATNRPAQFDQLDEPIKQAIESARHVKSG